MSTLLAPVTGDRLVHRINPVAKVAASAALGIALLITIDPVSGAVALALELLLVPFAGVPARALFVRLTPLLVAAPLTALTIALYGAPSGEVYATFLLATISDGSLQLAASAGLRVLAIGLPAVLLVATVDPTDLADGLIQTWRLPARFVLGALAAFRLVGLLVEDWRALVLARRARGVGDAGGFLGRMRFLGSVAFALLVLALRRGGSLATAMEARAFGGTAPRTSARAARFGAAEWGLVAIGVAIAAASLTASVVTGAFHPILGPGR
ncbi:energy-coupling factor transporter transmembrane protein EcfT [Homoserinibacter sp. GY 40078]|uniref:energy-coupling factor transporter transmembrane component T family protein n=1 Tax=Homoserinibacter sp. GY 40078 TaxID=2603275 RepID=UPI0011CA8396|nr:energy-coupling factor transporter transmembrane component T [Homoserinibacter sp. GY 40078]TXK19632.1 energy-coupling factor transporter transmembrane protein EcfT [Homoserinibacter sp. GY 40078]